MVSGTIWQANAIRADGATVELGRGNARSRATEERAGKQWFLTPLPAQGTKDRSEGNKASGTLLGPGTRSDPDSVFFQRPNPYQMSER